MKKNTLLFIAVLALWPLRAFSSPGAYPEELKPSLWASEAYILSPVRASLRDGTTVEGRLLGLDESRILLRVEGSTKGLERKDLVRLTIKAESEKSRFFVTGALLGAYAMSLPIDHWNNSPALGYLRDSPFAIALVRALLGAGSGLLVGWRADSIFHRRLVSFGLDGQEAFPVEEWERLRLFLAGFGGGPSRFHLSVDAGFESAGGTKDCFRGLGPGFIYGENKPFTLFRRLRLEYSVFPAWRFGYTFASLGEAPREYWTKNCDPNLSVIQRTNGHYLTAAFTPAFRGASRNALTAALGLGGGVANVDLRTEAQYFAVSGAEERSERQEQNVNKLAPSVLVFAEAGIRLYRHLTIGLSADWAWVAAQELPAFAPALMPARWVSLSSGSLGFCLGLHI